MNRTFAFIGILVLLLGAIAYTTYRIWHILPLTHGGKSAVAALYLLCFLVIFPHYMLGSRMPFPLAAAMFEKAFGVYQRGDTRYYISSGLGIWGGKFRIGTRSEYIVLKLNKAH